MAWCRVFLESCASMNAYEIQYSQTSTLCHLTTMPPSLLYHFWSSPTKFNRKYIYYATTYLRYYATWGTVLQCINETINATNEHLNGCETAKYTVCACNMFSQVIYCRSAQNFEESSAGACSFCGFHAHRRLSDSMLASHWPSHWPSRNYCTVLYIILKYM